MPLASPLLTAVKGAPGAAEPTLPHGELKSCTHARTQKQPFLETPEKNPQNAGNPTPELDRAQGGTAGLPSCTTGQLPEEENAIAQGGSGCQCEPLNSREHG